ncbi:hypothetical protein Q3G72_008216 [Acer saccharum]|nr:hypothetical protein Q3G72_008216 [Acer saccharum]
MKVASEATLDTCAPAKRLGQMYNFKPRSQWQPVPQSAFVLHGWATFRASAPICTPSIRIVPLINEVDPSHKGGSRLSSSSSLPLLWLAPGCPLSPFLGLVPWHPPCFPLVLAPQVSSLWPPLSAPRLGLLRHLENRCCQPKLRGVKTRQLNRCLISWPSLGSTLGPNHGFGEDSNQVGLPEQQAR